MSFFIFHFYFSNWFSSKNLKNAYNNFALVKQKCQYTMHVSAYANRTEIICYLLLLSFAFMVLVYSVTQVCWHTFCFDSSLFFFTFSSSFCSCTDCWRLLIVLFCKVKKKHSMERNRKKVNIKLWREQHKFIFEQNYFWCSGLD